LRNHATKAALAGIFAHESFLPRSKVSMGARARARHSENVCHRVAKKALFRDEAASQKGQAAYMSLLIKYLAAEVFGQTLA
jgi:hypothetical protein